MCGRCRPGRFEPAFLEERRAALFLFLIRIRNHCKLRSSQHFISFLYQSEAQLAMEKKSYYQARDSDLRTSLTDWFGSALHTLATTVGKYEAVGLGFNPLDVQVDEIEHYVEPMALAMAAMEKAAKNLVTERRKCSMIASQWSRVVSKLGEMPFGPSITEEASGLSLSQILEMEPEPDLDVVEDDEYAHLQGKYDPEEYRSVNSYKFRSDISDLTADDLTFSSLDGTGGSKTRIGGGGGLGHGTEVMGGSLPHKHSKCAEKADMAPTTAVPVTLTTMAEAECNSYLRQLGCVCK